MQILKQCTCKTQRQWQPASVLLTVAAVVVGRAARNASAAAEGVHRLDARGQRDAGSL